MLSVYDRMLKLANDASLGEVMRIAYVAILNLTDEEDIKSFTVEHIKHYPSTAKQDIQYMLGFFDIDDRKLWQKAVGDVIHIDVLYNRCERELYKFFMYVDDKGKDLPPFYNKEKGNHQSK